MIAENSVCTVQMWHGVLVSSRHRKRQPEELGCRLSTTMYDGRSVMMMMLSEDNLEPQDTMYSSNERAKTSWKQTRSTNSKTRYSFPRRRNASRISTMFSCRRLRRSRSSRSVVLRTSSLSVRANIHNLNGHFPVMPGLVEWFSFFLLCGFIFPKFFSHQAEWSLDKLPSSFWASSKGMSRQCETSPGSGHTSKSCTKVNSLPSYSGSYDNRTIHRQTNSRSVKSWTGQLED